MNQETTFQAQALPAVTIELLPMRWQEVNSRGKPVGAAEVAKFGHTVAASVDGKRMLIGAVMQGQDMYKEGRIFAAWQAHALGFCQWCPADPAPDYCLVFTRKQADASCIECIACETPQGAAKALVGLVMALRYPYTPNEATDAK